MNVENQKEFEIQSLAVTIEKASICLHSSIKYIHTVSCGDFYNINVKDLFKLALSDISNPHILSRLGISPSDSAVFAGEQFAALQDLFFFAFAVRLPYLLRNPKYREDKSVKNKARLFNDVFEACVVKGAVDHDSIVRETFKDNMKAAMPRFKAPLPEPSFNGEWFRRWVYSHGRELSELAAITNRNMFLLGCVDALIPLYYAKLTEVLIDIIEKSSE